MNHNYYYGNGGQLSGLLMLGFLIMVVFFVGLVLVLASSGRGKVWGWYFIVISILLTIAAIVIYSATQNNVW